MCVKIINRSIGADVMEIYVPDCYQESIFTVNYELLKIKGIKCLLFDLDNTLMPYNKKEATEETKQLLEKLKQDFIIILFSNSPKKRVSLIASNLGIEFVYRAFKPSPNKFMEVFKQYKLTENQVAIIGDQIVTDIKGGNNVGITSILVKPISDYDPIWTKIGRARERKIIKKLRKNNLFKGRFYDEKM